MPRDVVQRGWIWQPVTYMFLHGGIFHILFNMLSFWMFGTDLERMWGSPFFARYYAVTGIGAGIVTVLVSLLPFQEATRCTSDRPSAHRAPSSACCSPTA